jgi:hypothetical protein
MNLVLAGLVLEPTCRPGVLQAKQLICLRKEENACVEARKLHGSEAQFVLRCDCVRAPLRRPTTGRMI